jgi:methionyl-tRNA formyltransferase
MNLVFFGSGAFGVPTLAHLSAVHTITGVVTQPDRPAGRGGHATPTPVAAWAAANLPAVPLFKPERASQPPALEQMRALPADAWVVIAFGQKLSRSLLQDRFAINLHASLLPRWRGAAPINAAILAGDPITGNSVITLADRMDAGLVLAQSLREITPTQTAGELHDLLSADGPALVESVLAAHADNTLRPTTQDESAVTLAPKLSKSDGWIDPGQSAEECRRRINALSPWPGVTVQLAGQPLKLLRADCSPIQNPQSKIQNTPPGTLIDPDRGLISCADHAALQLLEVQPPGKRPMPWADFARGRRLSTTDQITGGPRPC